MLSSSRPRTGLHGPLAFLERREDGTVHAREVEKLNLCPLSDVVKEHGRENFVFGLLSVLRRKMFLELGLEISLLD